MDKKIKQEPVAEHFDDRKIKILTEIEQLSIQYESFWKYVEEEFLICNTLILKQAFLSGRFSEFHVLWQEKVDENLDLDSARSEELEAVNEQVQQINTVLLAQEQKAHDAQNGLKDLTEIFQKKLADLQKVESECRNATTLEELQKFNPQEFRNCQVTCPDVKRLSSSWDQLGLHSQLDQCFERLRRF